MFCEVPVCKDCVSKVSDHKGHKYKGIHEGAKEKREKVNPMIKSMHEYLPCLQDYVGEMEHSRHLSTASVVSLHVSQLEKVEKAALA
jgi:hypothetical protein